MHVIMTCVSFSSPFMPPADLARLEDCKQELHSILQEERLFGATLLVLANKQDLPSALKPKELEQVGCVLCVCRYMYAVCACVTVEG